MHLHDVTTSKAVLDTNGSNLKQVGNMKVKRGVYCHSFVSITTLFLLNFY